MSRQTMNFVIAALLLATQAHASSTANASLGPLTLQVIDLDLTDGVTPAITFGNPPFGAAESYVRAFVALEFDFQRNIDSSTTPFHPLAVSASLGSGQANATLAGLNVPSGTSFFVSGSSGDFTGPSSLLLVYEAESGQAEYGHTFTISPNTQLIVSADASVAIQGSGPGQTSALSTLMLRDYLGFSTTDALGFVANPSAGEPFEFVGARSLSVSYANNTTTELAGYFTFGTTIHGEVYATPVPEIATSGLLLAGLGFLSLARMRVQKATCAYPPSCPSAGAEPRPEQLNMSDA